MAIAISLVTLFAVIGTVWCHMEMSFPPPRRSRFNPNVPASQIDYNMNFPLLADGSQLPCKKYARGVPAAQLSAGQTFVLKMFGTTFHSGGHCQFSISYDDQTFVVLKTVMKNCFVGTGLDFSITLPSTTPACDRCTIAWSWVNAIGNREFYMNCADVKITSAIPLSSQVIVGTNYTVANMPGYPIIPEFPPSTYDGSDIYARAPTVTIRAGSTSVTSVTSRTSTIPSTTSLSSSSSSITSVPTSAPSSCSVVGQTKCTGQKTFVQCTSAKTYANKTCPSNTVCNDSAGYVQCLSGSSGTCQTGDSMCNGSSKWSLCSNGVFYDMGVCPTGTVCKQISSSKSECT